MENAIPTRATVHWDNNRHPGLDTIRAYRAALQYGGAKKGRAATASCSLIALAGATLSAAFAVSPTTPEWVSASAADQIAPQAIRSVSPAAPTRDSAVSRSGYRAPLLAQNSLAEVPSEAAAVESATEIVAEAEAIAPETTFATPEDLAAIEDATALVNELIRRAETVAPAEAEPVLTEDEADAAAEIVEPAHHEAAQGRGRAIEPGATAEAHQATSPDAVMPSVARSAIQTGEATVGLTAPLATLDTETPAPAVDYPAYSSESYDVAGSIGRHSRGQHSRAEQGNADDARAAEVATRPEVVPAPAPPKVAAEVAQAADAAIAMGARLVADSTETAAADVAEVSDADAIAAALTLATAHLETLVADPALAAPVSVVPAPMAATDMLAFQTAEALAAAPELAQHIGSTAGFANGQIPQSVLCAIPWDLGEQARCDAVAQLERLNEAFKAEFGYDLGITDSYRSYAQQVSVKASRGHWAAPPGTSNHGWGLALDLGTGISNYGSPQYNWMYENAPKFGWQNPDWARPGGTLFEPWHWEYTPLNGG